jgi:hypothetical protein
MSIIGGGADGEHICPSDTVIQAQPYASQRAMEFCHLQHFKRLVKQQHPNLCFRLIGDGGDPPDFIICREGASLGLELTVFASPQRRERAALISDIHDRLIVAYDNGSLRGLTGIRIDLSFFKIGARPTRTGDAALSELVAQLDAIARVVRTPLPANWVYSAETHPAWASGEVDGGAVKWQVSSISNTPLRGSKFANHTGFEIEYTHREWLAPDEIQKTIEQCVRAKDKPGSGNDELLIVAGAPGKNGRAYPAEAMAVLHHLKNWQGLEINPQYLKRVFLDVWGPEKLYVIYEKSEN